MVVDRVHRLPRIWSNGELRKFAHLFEGDVVNVSAWTDADKEGGRYRDYFCRARSYSITNFKAEAKGLQGVEGEIFLDLSTPAPPELVGRFDAVFNHTTLEHIFDVKTAFSTLCSLSRDAVILCVPFLQPYHGTYGDYWRFSPQAVRGLFEENGLALLYLSFNSHKRSSVYVLSIASRHPELWEGRFPGGFSCIDPQGRGPEPYVGCHAIPNTLFRAQEAVKRLGAAARSLASRLRRRARGLR